MMQAVERRWCPQWGCMFIALYANLNSCTTEHLRFGSRDIPAWMNSTQQKYTRVSYAGSHQCNQQCMARTEQRPGGSNMFLFRSTKMAGMVDWTSDRSNWPCVRKTRFHIVWKHWERFAVVSLWPVVATLAFVQMRICSHCFRFSIFRLTPLRTSLSIPTQHILYVYGVTQYLLNQLKNIILEMNFAGKYSTHIFHC